MTPTRFSLGTLVLLMLGLGMGRVFLHFTIDAQSHLYAAMENNIQDHAPADLEEARIQAEIETLRKRRAAAKANAETPAHQADVHQR